MPTNSLAAVFAFSFLVSFGAVISPGPVSAAIVTEAPRQGWRVGPLVAVGHTTLELIMVILISFGLEVGLAHPPVKSLVSFGGGLMLLFLGATYIIRSVRGIVRLPPPEEAAPPRSGITLLGLGALTTISNPFWYTWWVTVAAGYLTQAGELGIAAVIAFYIGHISADFGWDTALSLASSAGTRLLTDARYRILIVLTGGFMIYLGWIFLRNSDLVRMM
ncbi:MAG: LysE family transporter [Anaerolineales bacterium]|jgi:threonine/homoserine/homoserine lactone efflux protein